MRILLVLAVSSLTNCLLAQSLSEAERYFENYEYAKAAEIYAACSSKKALTMDDYKRLAYSYYVIGDYKKCLPLSDSIIKLKDAESLFYFINGEVNMGMKNYNKARDSYTEYQKFDREYDVSIKIKSCELIPTWSDVEFRSFTDGRDNDSKANINGQRIGDLAFTFSEIGKDSIGNLVSGSTDQAMLVMARPFVSERSGNAKEIQVEFEDHNFSISSMAKLPGTDQILLTISQPLSPDETLMAPHLYAGTYNGADGSISMITPWQFSGFEDSSSCAHPTVNEKGDIIVFSKNGFGTKGSDLYYTRKEGTDWTKPKPVKSLNTSFDDMYPMFSGDTLLSFASEGYPGYGGLDIFTSRFNGSEFESPEHLMAPVNSLKDDFNYLYITKDSAVFTSNRTGGFGDDDIYFIAYPIPVIIEEAPDSSDFTAFVDGWKDQKVYFQFDKYDLEKDIENLDQLVNFLREYPSSTITLIGHTDSRGSDAYNMELGYNRAKSVKYAMTEKGIKADQINVVSKGESEPDFKCPAKCKEQEHALNRVVVIKLEAK